MGAGNPSNCTECRPDLTPPPARLRLDSFYRKNVDANGFPIVSSSRVPDSALWEAQRIVLKLTKRRPEVLREMTRRGVRLAIMAKDELTIDIPEHRDLYEAFPQTDWNRRARGLGATVERPAVSVGEENLLGYRDDRYRGESILIHEFSHAMHIMGLRFTDSGFEPKLKAAYESAMDCGLWRRTYAATNMEEYWAEGVQSWFDANLQSNPPNGVHNEVNSRLELKQYDPSLARLVESVFGAYTWPRNPPRPIRCPRHSVVKSWPD